ncbi:MAG: hypothetical protein QHJ81_13275 [Anaerolineae bacterium]|nr:hypothetical protein [Anaerolineae bacterium]
MEADIHLEYAPLVETLRSHGWEVTAYDEVVGRREDASGVWTIAIDHGGRVRFTATWPGKMPEGRRLQRGRRRYRLLREEHVTLTVATKLETAADLPDVLDQLAAFATGRDP